MSRIKVFCMRIVYCLEGMNVDTVSRCAPHFLLRRLGERGGSRGP